MNARAKCHGLQGRAANLPKRFGEFTLIHAPDIGQHHLPAFAREQTHAEHLLENLHLTADRTLRQRQFVGGAGVAFMARGGLESQQ
ncbi:hypothetical protein D3C78_1756030 [compost metagenome]